MASAGKVLIMPKGTWAAGTAYSMLDMVYYEGNSFICKSAIASSVSPFEDTEHWQTMASGFDSDLITQEITNDPDHIASDAAVYAETQKLEKALDEKADTSTVEDALALKADTDDILTYDDAKACTDDSKIASATAIKALNDSLANISAQIVYRKTISAGGSISVDLSNAVAKFGSYLYASVSSAIYANRDNMPAAFRREADQFMYSVEDKIKNFGPDGLMEDAKSNYGMKSLYLTSALNQKVDAIQKEVRHDIRSIGEQKASSYGNDLMLRDNIGNALCELAEKSRVTEASARQLFKEYGFKLTDLQAQETVALIEAVRKMPTNMFEAKLQRVSDMMR